MDWWLYLFTLVTTGAGFFLIASAVGPEEAHSHLIRQGAALAMGVVAWVILLLLDYNELRGLYRVIYVLNIVMLLFVALFGMEVNGNKNWINLGVVQVQPSELGKILLIITLAKLLDSMERIRSWFDLIGPIAHVLPVFGMVLLQGDLGTALVFVVISIAMVYGAGFPGWKIASVGLLGAALVVGAVYSHYNYGTNFPLQGYQWTRIDTFLFPEKAPQDGGWQVTQSKVAIGTGGVWGKGLGEGEQHKNNWLPFPHTDFIFAVIGEELGFVGGAVLLGLFALLFFRLATVAFSAKDRFGGLIAIGVAALIGAHVVENIGMTMGVTPVTGIPLPFISYGPTALLANLTAIGLVQSVAARRDPVQYDR